MNSEFAPAAAGIMVPHPPILLPNVGRGEEKKISDIDAAMKEAASAIVHANPETVVIISPHAPAYTDYIQVSSSPRLKGSMAAFNDPADAFNIENDLELVREIDRLCKEENFAMGTLGVQDGTLDHGTMVPLYYLDKALDGKKYVRVSVGGLSNLDHYKAGMLIAEAADNLGRRIAVIGSGDLSHCQNPNSHYGFKPCGPKYDSMIMNQMGKGDFLALIETPEKIADDAMACGHKSFAMMAGMFDGYKPKANPLAHSAEFGVGYGVVTYTDPQKDNSRHYYQKAAEELAANRALARSKEDAYVRLARMTIDSFVKTGTIPTLPMNLPEEMYDQKAGTFVSIHKNGQLRGCIGTTHPVQDNLGLEIMANAISASSKDPRFYPIRPDELDELEISLDVLKVPEPCTKADLDVKKYGVIVTKGSRRGLLLPNLDGIDTVGEQLKIAKQKAGIKPSDEDVELERFEVVRHV